MTSLRAGVFGVLALVAIGCEGERVLGDLENGAGQGGDETGGTANGGASGTARGGTTASGGTAQGGAPTSGGTAQGGAPASGGTAQGGAPTNGGTAQGGTSPNGGSGGGVPCFSPDNGVSPQISNLVGCPCAEGDVDQCVATGTDPLSFIAMVCGEEGRWQLVEDGPCEPRGTDVWCLLENRLFMTKGDPVPPELLCDYCEGCGFEDPRCAAIICLPKMCPSDTTLGTRCRACGMRPGGCDIIEYGCFDPCPDGETCEFGQCSNGTCNVGPCI
jgi:hypothetical protein